MGTTKMPSSETGVIRGGGQTGGDTASALPSPSPTPEALKSDEPEQGDPDFDDPAPSSLPTPEAPLIEGASGMAPVPTVHTTLMDDNGRAVDLPTREALERANFERAGSIDPDMARAAAISANQQPAPSDPVQYALQQMEHRLHALETGWINKFYDEVDRHPLLVRLKQLLDVHFAGKV